MKFTFNQHFPACLIYLPVMFLISCEYQPNGEYFKTVEEKGPVPIVLTIDDNDSLISIWQRSELNYSVSPAELNLEQMDVFLNDNLINSYYSREGILTIDPYLLNDGNYPLRFEIYMHSGSGSLADKVDAELYLWKKDFILNIDRSISDASRITGVKVENGKLKIEWVKYPKENFEKYVLDDILIDAPVEIGNIDQNYYYDERYVGGSYFYLFRVHAAGNTTGNQYFNFELPYSHLVEFKTLDNNSVTMKWSKCLLYSNFSEYKISILSSSGISTELFSSTDVNDTVTHIDNFPFGKRTTFSVTTKSKDENIGTESIEYAFSGDTAFPYFSGAGFCPYPCENIYYSYQNNELYSYSTSDFSVSEILPNGNFLYRFTSDQKYLLVHSMGTGNLILYSVPQFEAIGSRSLSYLPVDYDISENGTAVVLSNDSIIFYNYPADQKQVLNLPNADYSQSRTYISADGKLAFLDHEIWDDKIYMFINGQYYQNGMPGRTKFYCFNPMNSKEYITFTDNYLNFFDTETMRKLRSISVPAFPSSNIDPVSGYFMVVESELDRDYSLFGIYDINSGQKVGQLTATTNRQSEYGKALTYLICNKTIYSPYGYKLKIAE